MRDNELLLKDETPEDYVFPAEKIMMDGMAFAPICIRYSNITAPRGLLSSDKACHALWNYYITMIRNSGSYLGSGILDANGEKISLTQEKLCVIDCYMLFKQVAKIYAVDPNAMFNYWQTVNMQAIALGLPAIPVGDKRRGIK